MKTELKITGVSGQTLHDGELTIATASGGGITATIETKDKKIAPGLVKGGTVTVDVDVPVEKTEKK